MNRRTLGLLVTSVLLVAFNLAGVANADIVSIQLDYNDFGHLENDGPRCAPTATINSFMYLWNKYPTIYQSTDLLTDYDGGGIGLSDLATDRNLLANGWQNQNGDERTGMTVPSATAQNIWENKLYWIEDFAPGTTVVDGMIKTVQDLSTWYGSDVLENAFPTWDFLWKELKDGEDVELLIAGLDESFGHALTLTSLKFDDTDGDEEWDAGETRWVDYLDPNKPSQLFEAELTLQADGSFKFNWHNGGANTATDVYIVGAYSESPIPEPATIAVWSILGGLGFYTAQRRKRVV